MCYLSAIASRDLYNALMNSILTPYIQQFGIGDIHCILAKLPKKSSGDRRSHTRTPRARYPQRNCRCRTSKGLTVIPWFEFGFMAPADSLLAKNRPQWLTSKSDGTRIIKEGTHNRVWLNPFRPEVQQFIQDLIVEIVRNYNIDGIQFDDHFGLPSELGYDAYTVALYKKNTVVKLPPKTLKIQNGCAGERTKSPTL